jgi:hypothetical protein
MPDTNPLQCVDPAGAPATADPAGSALQQACAGVARKLRELSATTQMLVLNLARQVRRDEALSTSDLVVRAAVERILNSQDQRDQSPAAQSITMSAVGTNAYSG